VATGGWVSAQTCASVSTGLKGWWQGENNALDLAGGYNGTVHTITYGSGKVGSCFVLDGASYVNLGASVGLFGTNDFSVEFWENAYIAVGTCLLGNDPNTSSGTFSVRSAKQWWRFLLSR